MTYAYVLFFEFCLLSLHTKFFLLKRKVQFYPNSFLWNAMALLRRWNQNKIDNNNYRHSLDFINTLHASKYLYAVRLFAVFAVNVRLC